MSGFVPEPYTRTNPFAGIGAELQTPVEGSSQQMFSPTSYMGIGQTFGANPTINPQMQMREIAPTGVSINPELQQATEMELPMFGKIGGMFNKAGGWGGLLSGLEGGISDWAKQQQASQVNDYDYMTPVSMANQVGGLSGGYFSGY